MASARPNPTLRAKTRRRRRQHPRRVGDWACAISAMLTLSLVTALEPAGAQEILYGSEGNRLRRYDIDTIGTSRLVEEIFVEKASGSATVPAGGIGALEGRDINGKICFFPDGSGRFLAGEDSGQPNPPAGWGIFDSKGVQVGKLTATYKVEDPEPHGCAFDSNGVLFTTSVGTQAFGANDGQLIMWFPPYEGYPGPDGAYPNTDEASTNFCKLATDIGTAASVVVDTDDNVYVASSSGNLVLKFAPPFPSGPGECGSGTGADAPMADVVNRSVFSNSSPGNKLFTPSGLDFSPTNTLYVSSVLTGRIGEYDLDGNFLRFIVDHEVPVLQTPTPFGSPQGISVGSDGTIYYADLDLQGFNTGPNGRVWRVRFDSNSGDPLVPELIRDGLSFPDGVTVRPGNLEQSEWLTYAGSAARKFFNPDETILNENTVAGLAPRWAFPAQAVITGSPSVAAVDLPGEGLTQVVYFLSWDRTVYALRLSDGSEVWRFVTDTQPGAAFEDAGSVHVEKLDNRDRIFIGAGEMMYSIDAVTGEEIWRFTAGTGCVDSVGMPPGLCAFNGERNQIESSPYVADGKVFFGMDVNDVETGKGGFYAVDALDGMMSWYFDPQSGQTCTPNPDDEIRKFDGYHTEAELDLEIGFLATRPGCDFPRDKNGCGNIWSSPAVDSERELLFTASSNCDTAIDDGPGGTGLPFPMPPFDEAIFALDFDGFAVWRWRPREFDNEDLAFGAVPNLFSIEVMIGGTPTMVDVVGVGGKDGTYYVLDRDGTNQVNGASWDDDPATHLPANLPYWSTHVVDGGAIGGIIATAAVDEDARRIFFSTAPGNSPVNDPPRAPQRPVVHGLDMDSGDIVWQNDGGNLPLASFGPTSAVPGVTFVGQTPLATVRYFQTAGDSGNQLGSEFFGNFAGLASGAVPIDGNLIMGEGVGTRTQTGSSPGDFAADTPSELNVLCVPGTLGCAACNDGIDNDGDGFVDSGVDDGCVSEADPSEILADLDYDDDVDESDRVRFFNAFGRRLGDPGFIDAADFDRDGIVSLVDYQTFQQALDDFNNPPIEPLLAPATSPSCGLLGIEPVLVLVGAGWMRSRKRRRRSTNGLSTTLSATECPRDRTKRRNPMTRLFPLLALLILGAALSAEPAAALSSVRVETSNPSPDLGSTFEVQIIADFTDPILGFGLDLDINDAELSVVAPPTIGPDWFAVFAPDGDGLAGLAGGAGVVGNDVLLATLTLSADDAGLSLLGLSITLDDLTEGFALIPTGFDAVVLTGTQVQVTPEPSTSLLLSLGLLAISARKRVSGNRTSR